MADTRAQRGLRAAPSKQRFPTLDPARPSLRALLLCAQWGLFAPGGIALVVGSLLLIFCRDSPESAGYPPVELPENASSTSKSDPKADPKEEEEAEEEQLSVRENLIQNVLSNPFIWGLALTYFCVYIVRQVRRVRRPAPLPVRLPLFQRSPCPPVMRGVADATLRGYCS